MRIPEPALEVRFDYDRLDGDASERLPDHYIIAAPETYIAMKVLEVKVSNKGGTSAKNCVARAEIIRNNKRDSLGEVTLHWARYCCGVYEDVRDRYMPIDIYPNDYEMIDLIYIVKEGSRSHVMIRCDAGRDLSFDSYRVHLHANDIVKIGVYCDNAVSEPICLRVKKEPSYNEINGSNARNFFEEVKCPISKS